MIWAKVKDIRVTTINMKTANLLHTGADSHET